MEYRSYNQYRTYMRWKVCHPTTYAMQYRDYNQYRTNTCDGKYAFRPHMRWNIGHTINIEHICDEKYAFRRHMQLNIGHTINIVEFLCAGMYAICRI